MTIAICTECGKEKFGAFSPCARCGFTPTSSYDQAKSVLMSNHHHTREELGRLGKEIEAGQPVTYDRAALALNERILECLEADPDAFQCTRCGEDVDWFGDTLCPECKANKE